MKLPRAFRRYLLRGLLLIVALYAVSCGLLAWQEPNLLYQPFDGPTEPAAVGLPGFTRHTLSQPGGALLTYWANQPIPGRPTILYFHGNGGGLHLHAPYIGRIAALGFHVVAMEYSGYPGVPGRPNQPQIVAEATALFDAIRAANPNTPIVIWGFSLGSGVAAQLAAARPPAALVLEAPFTATVDRAAELFPLFPIHRLMRDQYRSREVIDRIHAPLLILHGDADLIIPIHHGEALFAAANEPKTFRRYPGADHLDLMDHGAYEDVAAWLQSAIGR